MSIGIGHRIADSITPKASATETDPEKLKSTLQDPNGMMGEKYAALTRLQSLLEEKVNSNTATDNEKTLHGLLTNLKEGDATDSEMDQLSSLLGLDQRVLNWVKGKFDQM